MQKGIGQILGARAVGVRSTSSSVTAILLPVAAPLPLSEDKWIKAIDFRPGMRAVVRHSFFFLDVTGQSHKIRLADAQPGFQTMTTDTWQTSLSGWDFGGDPVNVPDGMAY